jgi:hypothetical protein
MGSILVLGAAAADSPNARLAAMMAAARTHHSVHYVDSWTNAGREWPDIVGDAGESVGVQHITWHKNGQVGHVTVIATASAAYVRGDAFALASYMLFPQAGASKYANRWIVIPKTASGYATVAAGVRFESAVAALRPPGTLTNLPRTTFHGQPVVGVQSNTQNGKLTVSLYGRATGEPLPVAVVGARGSSRFAGIVSRWDEPVRVTPPPRATPVSVVVATR